MFAIFEIVESQALFAIFEHHACELACAQPPTLGTAVACLRTPRNRPCFGKRPGLRPFGGASVTHRPGVTRHWQQRRRGR